MKQHLDFVNYDEPDDRTDDLDTARGLITAAILSLIFWTFIALIIWCH